ncbi:MAG: GNAT family N-acetyltransferase [Ignavibacteriaceae bacterium]|nr:GNAT family N-acetyltransferase [Ignavibacteriaceae bacterium]
MTSSVSEIITLRPLKQSDAEFLYNNVTDPDVIKQLRRLPDPYNLEHAYEFIALAGREALTGESGHFGVEVNGTGNLAGVIGALFSGNEVKQAEIGYWFAKREWGKGYASEAVRLMIEYLRSKKEIATVIARVFENNPASARVLIKNGFNKQGLSADQYCNVLNNSAVEEYKLILNPE